MRQAHVSGGLVGRGELRSLAADRGDEGACLFSEGPLRREVGAGEAALGSRLVDLEDAALLASQGRGEGEAEDGVLEEDLAAFVPLVDAVVRKLQEGRHAARTPDEDQVGVL